MTIRPAEVFPPGEFIKDILTDRGWTQNDLADIIDRHPSAVADLISGKKELTANWAHNLAEAFDTSPDLWMNLESAYRLSNGGSDPDNGIRERARIYELAPVREMKRRGWIANTRDDERVEADLVEFFGVTSLADEPAYLEFAARKSGSYMPQASAAERAWVQRVVNIAASLDLPEYDAQALRKAIPSLRAAAEHIEGVESVAEILAGVGVAFVVVKHLKGTKIDGACVFVEGRPVIGMSIRYDRIDNFWFTLMHEIGHALEGTSTIDVDLMNARDNDSDQMGEEVRANDFAANALINELELSDDIAAASENQGSISLEDLAAKYRIHPGVMVGRLQHRGLLSYSQGRGYLAKVRSKVVSTVVSDGWV